jgi:hypothetical protein
MEIKGKDILFSTHNFGELVAGVVLGGLTNAQTKRFEFLKQKEKLTDLQKKELEELEAKSKTPNKLSEGGKKIVQQIFREKIRKTYDSNFSNKYTEKGHEVETEAINRIARVNGWGLYLNANTIDYEVSDELGIGHPDVRPINGIGFDAKSSWSDSTFPLFEDELKDKNYTWQAKRYAMMTNLSFWYVCYSLENTPEHLVIREALNLWKKSNEIGEMTDEFLDKVRKLHNFDHLSDKERVKTFRVDLTEQDKEIAKIAVGLARDYFDELISKYKK